MSWFNCSALFESVVAVGCIAAAHNVVAASPFIERLDAGQNQTVVVYGTSLTAGGLWLSQLSSSLDASYPGQITWVNSGLSGKASNSGVANLSSRVLNHNPDAVFIEFAVNDSFTAYDPGNIDFGITPAQSQSNLNTMIDAILNQNPQADVVLQTMNPAWDASNGNQSGSKRPDLDTYYQGYRDVAASRGLTLIDNNVIWKALQSNQLSVFESYVSDGVHPNSAGYAHLVTPAIRSALGADSDISLLIDPATGRAVLQNQSGSPQSLISYTVSSPLGALQTNWDSLEKKNLAGWFEANTSTSRLSELNPEGDLILADRAAIDFETAWNTGGALDVSLVYQTLDGENHAGTVVYSTLTAGVGLIGDFDSDGKVDGLDFLELQRDFGGFTSAFTGGDWNGDAIVDSNDSGLWESHYGLQAANTVVSIVPEPSSLVLMLSAFLSSDAIRMFRSNG